MIKINLVNASNQGAGGIVFEGGGPGSVDIEIIDTTIQKQGALRLAMIFAGPLALWGYQQMTIPGLEKQRDQVSSEIAELKDFNTRAERSVLEIKKFKEDEQRIQARISHLDKISKNRTRDIKILELIQQVIPEKAWLTNLEMKSGSLVISGLAMSDFEVSSFMEAMAKSIYFLDVNLLSSAEIVFDGLNLKNFEIKCTIERAPENE